MISTLSAPPQIGRSRAGVSRTSVSSIVVFHVGERPHGGYVRVRDGRMHGRNGHFSATQD
jgi:hypothetical protein